MSVKNVNLPYLLTNLIHVINTLNCSITLRTNLNTLSR
jgi:hypothetical protein